MGVLNFKQTRIMNWISVKDRLPEEGQDVLCIRKSGESFYIPEKVEYLDGVFVGVDRSIDYNESTHRVSHWMPLPNPPNK